MFKCRNRTDKGSFRSVKSFAFLQLVIPKPSSLSLTQNICLQLFYFPGTIACRIGIGTSCLSCFYQFNFHYYPYGFENCLLQNVGWSGSLVSDSTCFHSATLLLVTCFFGGKGRKTYLYLFIQTMQIYIAKEHGENNDMKRHKPAQKKVLPKQNSGAVLLII